MDLNFFDALVYINMDHRTDRKESIQSELKRLKVSQKKIHRISGCQDRFNNGVRGCAKSHLAALDLVIENEWEKALVLEDDCIFSKNEEDIEKYLSSFFNVYTKPWDVFFLGGRIFKHENTEYQHIKRITHSNLAHSYVINHHYLPTLRECYINNLEKMKYDFFFYQSFINSLDFAWKPLQQKDKWFACKGLITQQCPSFSDIEGRMKKREYYLD